QVGVAPGNLIGQQAVADAVPVRLVVVSKEVMVAALAHAADGKIGTRTHAASVWLVSSTIRLPAASQEATAPGGMISVDEASSIMAGPAIFSFSFKASRASVGAFRRAPSAPIHI